MTSPIAGNESFTNVNTLAAQVPSLDAGSVRVKSLVPYASRPPLSGLGQDSETNGTAATPQTIVAGGGTTNPTGGVLRNNTIIQSDWTGGAATAVTLPAALAGSVVVIHQNAALAGVNSLVISCASGDAFVANSCVNYGIAGATAQTTVDLLTFSAQGNNTLTVAAAAGVCAFSLGSMLYFNCTDNGLWHVSHDLIAVGTVTATATDGLSFSTAV